MLFLSKEIGQAGPIVLRPSPTGALIQIPLRWEADLIHPIEVSEGTANCSRLVRCKIESSWLTRP